MNNSKKILEMISGFIEAGILTSQDLRKELSTSLKFQSENLINRLDLVKKKEFQILGPKSNLDSLIIVNLFVAIEEKIKSLTGKEVNLLNRTNNVYKYMNISWIHDHI